MAGASCNNSVLLIVGSYGKEDTFWKAVEGAKYSMRKSKTTFEVAGNTADGCEMKDIAELASSLIKRSAGDITAIIFCHGDMYDDTHKVDLSAGDPTRTTDIFACLSEVASRHDRLVDVVLLTCKAAGLVEAEERKVLPPDSTVLFLGGAKQEVRCDILATALGWARTATTESDYTACSLLDVVLRAAYSTHQVAPLYSSARSGRVDLRAASEALTQTLSEEETVLLDVVAQWMRTDFYNRICHPARTIRDLADSLSLAQTKALLDFRMGG